MTDTEILDFCEENDVEVSFNFEKLTEGYRIRIRRGYFQYCTFVKIGRASCRERV